MPKKVLVSPEALWLALWALSAVLASYNHRKKGRLVLPLVNRQRLTVNG